MANEANAYHISLNDRTIQDTQDSDAERSDSEAQPPSSEPLTRKPTGSSLRDSLQQRIIRQKYARYQTHRYEQDISTVNEQDAIPQGIVERGRARAAAVLRGNKKRLLKSEERDAVIDILYENQRGSFFFGIPRYSSNSLLQFDPKPWQNADFRTSAVDIRNAQVPDPSWQWVWKGWYVDMSRDVDEEGWEYSLAFPPQFPWHGNHPWFHSFVRRRRWLRRRVRKDTVHKTKEKAHELAPDYFTIHTKILSARSQADRSSWNPLHIPAEAKIEDIDVSDILSLTHYMRRARIDREKLFAVRKFIEQGGEDLHYLAERMSELMSLFVYQSSRRQLLAELIQYHDVTKKRKESLASHKHPDDDKNKQIHDSELRKADNLLSAIHAADEEVQKLEYWSDIKEVAQNEDKVNLDQSTSWDKRRWEGITQHSNTFKSKQKADDIVEELHNKPEKHKKDSSQGTDSSGYTTAPSITAQGKRPPSVVSRVSTAPQDDDTDNALERFVTASEGPVSSIKPKQYRGKESRRGREQALQLDGLEEEDDSGVMGTQEEDDTLHEIDVEEALVRD